MRKLACLALLLLPAIAGAQERRFELTPFGSFRFDGNIDLRSRIINPNLDIDDSFAYGLILDIPPDLQPPTRDPGPPRAASRPPTHPFVYGDLSPRSPQPKKRRFSVFTPKASGLDGRARRTARALRSAPV